MTLSEPVHEILVLLAYGTCDGSDEPGKMCIPTAAFVACMMGQDLNKNFECKIVNIFLSISFNIMFWVFKRTVSLSRFF